MQSVLACLVVYPQHTQTTPLDVTCYLLLQCLEDVRAHTPIAQTHRHNAHARTRAAARGTPLPEVRRHPTRPLPDAPPGPTPGEDAANGGKARTPSTDLKDRRV